ncbi:MAG: conjugal transfer protein TraR [Bacillota bacterium]
MATKSAKKQVKKAAPAPKPAAKASSAKTTAAKKTAAKAITTKSTTAKKADKKPSAAAKPAVKKMSEKEKPKRKIVQTKPKETMKKGTDKKPEVKTKKEPIAKTASKAEPKKAAAKKNEVKKAGVNRVEANIVDAGSIATENIEEKYLEQGGSTSEESIGTKESHPTVVEVTSPKKNVRKIKGYSKEDLEYFKKIILDKRNEIIEQLQNLREQMMDPTTGQYVNENSPYSLHMAEQGTDAMEREKIFLWAQRENKFLGYLDDALHRIENGTYGICIECIDEPQNLCPTCPLIAKERLAAVPHSQLCLPVKQKQEKR